MWYSNQMAKFFTIKGDGVRPALIAQNEERNANMLAQRSCAWSSICWSHTFLLPLEGIRPQGSSWGTDNWGLVLAAASQHATGSPCSITRCSGRWRALSSLQPPACHHKLWLPDGVQWDSPPRNIYTTPSHEAPKKQKSKWPGSSKYCASLLTSGADSERDSKLPQAGM